jgi:predicted anti-sigma-YlaC factor YlaD
MDCPDVRESLEAYGAGELDAAVAGEVRRHLESCVDCSLYSASLGELVADLRHAGHAVRYLQPFSLPDVAAPRQRSRSLRIAWAFAAAGAAWAVLATVLVMAPSVSERLSAFPTGQALHDARAAARAGVLRSQHLAAANALLAQRLAAARLDVPLAAVQVAQSYLATQGSAVLGVQPQTKLTWTLLGALGSHVPRLRALTAVTLTAAATLPPGSQGSTTRLQLQVHLVRLANGGWSVREATVQ